MALGDVADLGADALDAVALGGGEGGPFLVDAWTTSVEPALVELVAHVAFEEGAARHPVALGEAQHLAAERGQAAVVAVELLDQIFDLAPWNWTLSTSAVSCSRSLWYFFSSAAGKSLHRRERVHARRLDLARIS